LSRLCQVAARIASNGKAEFGDFLRKVAKSYPRRQLHVVLDNYHPHKHAEIDAWLAKNPRVHLHCTPTSGSWLNPMPVSYARGTALTWANVWCSCDSGSPELAGSTLVGLDGRDKEEC
jgi:hypothetical protein